MSRIVHRFAVALNFLGRSGNRMMTCLGIGVLALRVVPLSVSSTREVLMVWHSHAMANDDHPTAKGLQLMLSDLQVNTGAVAVVANAEIRAIALLHEEPLTLCHLVATHSDTHHGSKLVQTLHAVAPDLKTGPNLHPRWKVAAGYFRGPKKE